MINRNQKYNSYDKTLTVFVCLLCMLLLSVTIQAEEEPVIAKENSELLNTLGKATKLSTSELDEERAKANLEIHRVTINDQDLNGVVSGNTAIGNETGDNIVSNGAFTNAAGFISTVQNSGNNVLIQNSTIINVAIEP